MARTKYPQYIGLTKEQARKIIWAERNKDEPNGELIDFCKRRISRIEREEKGDSTLRKKVEKALDWDKFKSGAWKK